MYVSQKPIVQFTLFRPKFRELESGEPLLKCANAYFSSGKAVNV